MKPTPTFSRFGVLQTLLCALVAISCTAEDPEPFQPPHVLLISVDTLRADHLGCYGYERETSPNLDALAARGARFERTFASSSWTLPSHMTMLTGLPVSAHGICDDRLWTRTDAAGELWPVLRKGVFLPEVLHEAGYRTGGFYTWKYLEPRFGFGPGFEVYERLGHTFYSYPPVAEEFERLRAAGDVEGLKALAAKHPGLFDATRQSSPETIERALEWIDQARRETPDAPIFAFVHLFDAHDPYTPPTPYDSKFDPGYAGTINGKNITSPGSPFKRGMDPRDLEHVVALYDGGIAWVDSQLGLLFDELEARGMLDETLVIVTSDHGEEFFEHGGKTHRSTLYRESLHVPWIVAWPGQVQGGREIGGATGGVDLATTIYGLLGLRAPEGSMGRDLSALLRGEGSNAETTYLSELLLFEGDGPPKRRVSLLTGDEHILLGATGDEPWQGVSHDLAADFLELNASAAFRLDEASGAHARERLEAQRTLLNASRAASLTRDSGSSAPLTGAELAELAAMGYAGSGGQASSSEAPTKTSRLCIDGCQW